MNNSMNIEDAYYKFNITSENENDLFPISGELFIKKEKYFIDTEEIDQIFDGNKLFTIIHENEEIIATSNSNTFFNFTPKQIFNFFKDDFEIKVEKSQGVSYILIARNLIQQDLIYKIIITSDSNTFFNLTPKQIFNFFKDDFEIEIVESQDFSYNLIARDLTQRDLTYKITIDSKTLSIERIDIENEDNITLSSFLTLSYKFNLSLPSSLFKFDKNMFNDYMLIENWKF